LLFRRSSFLSNSFRASLYPVTLFELSEVGLALFGSPFGFLASSFAATPVTHYTYPIPVHNPPLIALAQPNDLRYRHKGINLFLKNL